MKINVEELKSYLKIIDETVEFDTDKTYLITLKNISKEDMNKAALKIIEIGKNNGVKMIAAPADIIDSVYELNPENQGDTNK